jgi:N-acetylglucosamine-6-phosphate deacetylase
MTHVLTNARVVLPGQVLDGWVHIDGSSIVAVGDGEVPAATSQHDLRGSWLVPGFVDMHVHGGGGEGFQSGDAEAVRRAAHTHRRQGTTTLMASLVSRPVDELIESVARLRELVTEGAVAGIHLEGPFLSHRRCGAHDPAHLVPPDAVAVARLLDACGGAPTMVTIAPELEGALDAVHRLAEAGAVVAVGHTDATYQQTREAIGAGARVATHLYNAMPPAHHRHPGPVLALLEDERVCIELIHDGEHLHDAVVRSAFRAAGPGRVALVSDGIAAAGLGDGDYLLGGQLVEVRDGAARLAGQDALAGSAITTAQAVRNAVTSGIPLTQAVTSATLTPARALGVDGRVGRIAAGMAADMVVLDAELDVTAVMADGGWVGGDPR